MKIHDRPPIWVEPLAASIAQLVESSKTLSVKRTELLSMAAGLTTDALAAVKSKSESVGLTFICTHNSRRSHLSEIWALVAANHYGVSGTACFSGGTEATACNPRIVRSLRRAGFSVVSSDIDQSNPQYSVQFAEDRDPHTLFSKRFDGSGNPNSNFVAMMCCSDADEKCPLVSGSVGRVALHYRDPKESDGTPEESQTYDQRRDEIGAEMFFLMREIANRVDKNE